MSWGSNARMSYRLRGMAMREARRATQRHSGGSRGSGRPPRPSSSSLVYTSRPLNVREADAAKTGARWHVAVASVTAIGAWVFALAFAADDAFAWAASVWTAISIAHLSYCQDQLRAARLAEGRQTQTAAPSPEEVRRQREQILQAGMEEQRLAAAKKQYEEALWEERIEEERRWRARSDCHGFGQVDDLQPRGERERLLKAQAIYVADLVHRLTEDGDTGREALVALTALGPEALPHLKHHVKTASSNACACIAYALADIGTPECAPLLLHILKDEHWNTRAGAASLLAGFPSRIVIQALIGALSDGNGYVRRSAVESLGRIGGEQAVAALSGLIDDGDAVIAVAARTELLKMAERAS